MGSILYYALNALAIGLLLGLVYLFWYGFKFKEYDIIFGLGFLTVFPLSVYLINSYPFYAALIIYVLWFFFNFSSNNKIKEGAQKDKQSLGSLAWDSLKHTAITLLVAFVISTIFTGGGSDGGSCSRISPQFC
jgi:Na+/H+ antiporter NhaC